MKKTRLLLTLASIIFFTSCKMADVRTDYMLSKEGSADLEKKGRQILSASIEAMGYDKLDAIESYETTAKFDWRFPWSSMPLNSLPGAKGNDIQFKFKPNSFDGQVEYLEGRKKGDIHGLQSWKTYRLDDENKPEYTKDKRRSWGLSSYHYMLEGPYRLINADIVTYAGVKEFEGQKYDLVFVSWETEDPHKEHDQWLLYINQKTKFVDLANLTIRDFFLPFPPNMAEGTVRYLDRVKTSAGIHLPSDMVIQLMAPKKEKKHVYRITFKDYKFDSFPQDVLQPFDGLKDFEDSKPTHSK
ncbi:MAG: hypothetical protein AAFN93_09340 [Bacteroidota bacterium]